MVTQVLECQSCGGVVFSEGEQDIKAWALLSLISDRAGSLSWDRNYLRIA